METKHKRTAFGYLGEVSGREKWNVLVLIIVQAAQGICSVYYALFLRDIINAAVAKERREFFACIIGFGLLLCLQIVLAAINRYLQELTRAKLENRLKDRLFNTILSRDYGQMSAIHSGEWMNRLTSDTVVVADGMTQILPGLIGMLVRLFGAVIAIMLMEPRFVYLILPGGILLIVFSFPFRNLMKNLHKVIQERDGNLRMYLQEALASMLVVHSFGMEKEVSDEASVRMEAHKQARMRRNHFSNFCNSGFSLVMNGAYLIGALVCGYGILTGTLSYGTFMAVMQLIGQVQSPFANISNYLPRYYAMIASAERLMEAEDLEENDIDSQYALSDILKCYDEEFKGIGLKNATFTYLPPVQNEDVQMPVVFDNVSIDITKSEYVALVGPSGCGKSTLLKLLMCIYPLDNGERYVELVSRREPLTSKWQKLFAYVPQGNFLISGTIREVVAFTDKEQTYDDERMKEALYIACADEFVDKLDNGIDTLLGERGLGLSEGQMQRLAIARAIFSMRPILILDECTSALDAETEKKLLERLRSMTDRTLIIVTHRPAALNICDKIVRFSDEGCLM